MREERNSTEKILSDGTVKDTGFLGEISDVGIDRDISFIGMKVTSNKFHEGRFPSSTLSDKRCFLSWFNGERKVLKYIRIIVAVGDVFDDDGFLFG